jgi:hypothetical protein
VALNTHARFTISSVWSVWPWRHCSTWPSSISINWLSYITCVAAMQSFSPSTLILPCPPHHHIRRQPSPGHSSLPPPAFPAPKTPRRRRDPATALGLTPVSRGSSIRRSRKATQTESINTIARTTRITSAKISAAGFSLTTRSS